MNSNLVYKLLEKLQDNEKYILYLESYIEELHTEIERLKTNGHE